ncbi:MAG TPA: hypothetical protein VNW71_15875 [Thermoanaerobaculia bacterium]|nr:hypothetical protein [Thermoanaerobaculia bacterium]
MNRELRLTPAAQEVLHKLQGDPHSLSLFKQVRKTLALLETNLRHPSLNAHKFRSLRGPSGEEVFEAYVQNQTPGAYRVFFYYGPDRIEAGRRIAVLTVIDITPHP